MEYAKAKEMIEITMFPLDTLRNQRKISVSIIDTGFLCVPNYARLYTPNESKGHFHGNRVLDVFTSPDKSHPIQGLTLNLAATGPAPDYSRLIYSINSLPESDLISISICWKDDNQELLSALMKKARVVVAPCENKEQIYPARYRCKNMVVCCDDTSKSAHYCIKPRKEYNGSSYAVPAIARLLCYTDNLDKLDYTKDCIDISDLFSSRKNQFSLTNDIVVLNCKHCHQTLKNKNFSPMQSMPDNCPYCGMRLK